MYSQEEYVEIETKIKGKETLLPNGCLKWNDYVDKEGRMRVYYKNNFLFVPKFKYEQKYSTTLTDPNLCLKKDCETHGCTNIEHYTLSNRKRCETKDEIWKRILHRTTKVDDCLVWNGYASGLSYRGVTTSAHRLSYFLHKNNMVPIPKTDEEGNELVIRHMCKTKNCVNPDHLEIGTHSQNSFEDKIRDGTTKLGENHPRSKITQETASAIKLSRTKKGQEGHKTQQERADMYGVSKHTVGAIDRGISWAHIPDSNGKTGSGSSYRHEQRAYMKKARERVWSNEDFDAVLEKIKLNVLFSSKNKKNNSIDGDCWEWLKAHGADGYGKTCFLGKKIMTHVASCESKNKRHQKKDEVTRHLCGNRICCNPGHLEFGSRHQNNMDALEQNGGKHIKAEDVPTIRNSMDSYMQLSEEYGVSKTTISSIKRRKTWSHIN